MLHVQCMLKNHNFVLFCLAHKPQIWKSRLIRKTGKTRGRFLCYSIQREKQVSGDSFPLILCVNENKQEILSDVAAFVYISL